MKTSHRSPSTFLMTTSFCLRSSVTVSTLDTLVDKGCDLIQPPQANWLKSSQGFTVSSMALRMALETVLQVFVLHNPFTNKR